MNIGEFWGDDNHFVEIIDITEHEVVYYYLDEFGKRKPRQSEGFRTMKTQFEERFHFKEEWERFSSIETPKNRLATVD